MSNNTYIFDEEFIRSKLKQFDSPERLSLDHEKFIHSAVIFLIVPHAERSYDLILIRRTKHQKDKHSGEMSFPGGKYDPKSDKSYQDTAQRELMEELAISTNQLTILGCIDDHLTPKGFIITPFVGYINEELEMRKQDGEVQEIVNIPVSFFSNRNNYRERTYYLKDDLIGVGKFKYKTVDNKKYVIFGATSHIIVNFIDKVYDLGLKTSGCRRVNCKDLEDRIVN
ncbi:MAG: NUDIX hydrolase [Promethearchaeota archaeon]